MSKIRVNASKLIIGIAYYLNLFNARVMTYDLCRYVISNIKILALLLSILGTCPCKMCFYACDWDPELCMVLASMALLTNS